MINDDDEVLGVLYLHFLGHRHDLAPTESTTAVVGEIKSERAKLNSIKSCAAKALDDCLKEGKISLDELYNSDDKLKDLKLRLSEKIEKSVIHEKIEKINSADIVLIYLYNEKYEKERSDLEINDSEKFNLCYSSMGRGWENKERPRVDGAGEMAINEKRLVVAQEGLKPDINPDHIEKGVKTTAAIPLRYGDKIFGLMYLHFLAKRHYFTEIEKDLVQAFATSAAIAIETMKSFRDLTILYEIGREVRMDIELKDVGVRIAEGIKKVAGGGIPNIFLYNEMNNRWDFLACRKGYENNFPDLRPRDTGIGSIVVKEGRSVFIEDVQRYKDAHPLAKKMGIKTTLAYPLKSKDKVLGVLYIHFMKSLPITDVDNLKLSMFASKAATAIENAKRYQAFKKAREEVEVFSSIAWNGIISSAYRHQLVQDIFSLEASILSAELSAKSHVSNDSEKEIVLENLSQIKNIVKNLKLAQGDFKDLNSNIETNIESLINLVLKKHDRIIKNKNIKLDIDKSCKDLPDIRCNPRWLEIVFENLIHNALRDMGTQGNLIFKGESMDNSINIWISDNGKGIPEEKKPYIFVRKVPSTQGLGTGLLITKLILQKYGGDIRLESSGQKGTTFMISLPTSFIQD